MLQTADVAMNRIAESYVRLVLTLGRHDPDYVDAYHGPPEWRAEGENNPRDLGEIKAIAQDLLADLRQVTTPADDLAVLRVHYLTKQLGSIVTRVDMLDGVRLTFDEESRALYDAVAPEYPERHFQTILDDLSTLLPGAGPLRE